MSAKTLFATPSLAVLLVNAGCILPFGPRDVSMQVSRATGVELEPELQISMDGLTLSLLATLAPVPVPVNLSHVGWFELGMYAPRTPGRKLTTEVLDRLELPEWEQIARVRDPGSEVRVYVRTRGDAIRSMLVLVFSSEDVIIARMHGRMHALMNDALDTFGGWGGFAQGLAGNPAATERDPPADDLGQVALADQ